MVSKFKFEEKDVNATLENFIRAITVLLQSNMYRIADHVSTYNVSKRDKNGQQKIF
jgi:hypothetical protein